MSINNVVFIPFHDEVNIIFDKEPSFTLIVTSYINDQHPDSFPYDVDHFFNIKTECKGDMIIEQIKILENVCPNYKFVAMYDDDIEIKISDIEKVFAIAENNNLDLFAPSLTHDSYHTFNFTLNHGNSTRKVDWVEIMMPHFSKKFIDEFKPHLHNLSNYNLKSGYGFDITLFPIVLKSINGECAIVDQVTSKHNRPIRSCGRTFTNGLMPGQEMEIVNNYANTIR